MITSPFSIGAAAAPVVSEGRRYSGGRPAVNGHGPNGRNRGCVALTADSMLWL